MLTRIALGIEYYGHGFLGWQKQPELLTIQGCLQNALSVIADQPVEVFCAGRTDAGVHATGQIVHFDTIAERPLRSWIMGTNTHLPRDISVQWAQFVDTQFHARFSALSRCYQYIIYNAPTRPALLASRVTWSYEPLDAAIMHTAAQQLIGEHDFTSYRSAQCESKTAMRNVQKIDVIRRNEFVIIQIQANAFLHHMVRNIVGVLKKIGEGVKNPTWAKEVLNAKDRKLAAETAPPDGLYLTKVEYPANYDFPTPRNLLII